VTVAGLVLVAIFGLMIGSFLNVCIGRIPAGESIVSPGSRCPACRTPIAWYDNIPILGYILLGARCRRCHAVISARYPLIEGVTAIAFVLQALVIGDDIPLLVSRLILTALLIVLFGTDLDTQRLPDVLTLPGLALGILSSCFLPPGIIDSLIGAALGAGILLLIRWLWKRLKGVDGMGLGDVKMLAMIGAFLGWKQIWIVLFLSSFAGAIIGLSLSLARGRSMQSRLPFGTFLALAAYAASLWGDRLLNWYLTFSGMQ
jgi:leader peptidase (prepilin peptidase)/N-methyltransferase